jgi:hypothetical protein
MMIKRFLTYACLALCACFGTAFASTAERPVEYLLTSLASMSDFQPTAAVRLDVALVHWRTGSETAVAGLKSNLRAEGNHFVMSSAKPQPGLYEDGALSA